MLLDIKLLIQQTHLVVDFGTGIRTVIFVAWLQGQGQGHTVRPTHYCVLITHCGTHQFEGRLQRKVNETSTVDLKTTVLSERDQMATATT